MLLSDAIDHFMATRRRLAPATHRAYHYNLASLASRFPGADLASLQPLDLDTYLAGLPSGHAHYAAKRIATFYRWAKAKQLVPAEIRPSSPHKPQPWRPWSQADLAAYRRRWPPGSRQRAIFEAALATGLRRADLARLLWQPNANAQLRTTSKTDAPIYLLPPAADYGPPLSPLSLGMAFTGWSRAAGLRGRSLHGLRKTAATLAAEAGCTSFELMALFGWRTLRMAEHYTAGLDRARLASSALAKLGAAR